MGGKQVARPYAYLRKRYSCRFANTGKLTVTPSPAG
jgi:hypothetical protein